MRLLLFPLNFVNISLVWCAFTFQLYFYLYLKCLSGPLNNLKQIRDEILNLHNHFLVWTTLKLHIAL
jgi:hypothetical protein